MGDKFLTKEIADALCTVITLGFIENNKTAKYEYSKTTFEYSKGSDPKKDKIDLENHKVFTDWIKDNLEIVLNIDQAKQQSEMPFIISKTKRVYTEPQIEGVVDVFRRYARQLDSHAQDKNAPRGAYIGGRSTVSAVDIIGSTALSSYPPKYRTDTNGIAENYKAAVKEINKAIEVLDGYKHIGGPVSVRNSTECCTSPPDSIGEGLLFRSYHGMIRAMVEISFEKAIETDAVYFEIALGVNTPKVSSCIPCSIFMSANDMAATSTHFGRGDNWSIPGLSGVGTTSESEGKWRAAVINHYTAGLELFKERFEKINKMKTALLSTGSDEEIPAIFLEALTFEGPFLKKMANTLGFPYKE
jgi:hypothetical protein